MIRKRGYIQRIGWESWGDWFDPKYKRKVDHVETTPPTEEDLAVHARAVELLAELERNPYYRVWDDRAYIMGPTPTTHYVYAETVEEWRERCLADPPKFEER